MKQLSLAFCALAFVMAACSGTETTSVPPVGSLAIPSNLSSAAADQLCVDANPASLASIAAQLDKVISDTNTADIESKLSALETSLRQMPVNDSAQSVRNAAVTAVTQLQTSIKDPATKQEASKKAAEAIRAVDTAVCK